MYFPNRDAAADGVLQRVIGQDAVRRLGDHFGNLVISIPRMPGTTAKEATGRRVRELLASGVSVAAVAQQTGLSERGVYHHRRAMRESENVERGGATANLSGLIRRHLLAGETVSRTVELTGAKLDVVRGHATSLRRRGELGAGKRGIP